VDTFDDMTDKPPVPENQDVFVRVIFNNTLATCRLINIESAMQRIIGIKVTASVILISCNEVIIQNPLLKEVCYATFTFHRL